MPPLAVIALIALVSAVVILLVMRATSNQRALAMARRELRASVYEVWLFRHDPTVVSRSVGEMLRLNVRTLRLSLVPALWMVIPFTLLGGYLESHYGYRGLDVGRAALLTVRLAPVAGGNDEGAAPRPRLVPLEGMRVEAAVWIPSLHEMAWRIVPERPGRFEMAVEQGGHVLSKVIAVSDASVARSPLRGSGLLDRVFRFGEPALPKAAGVRWIGVTYPRASIDVLGWECHWAIPFVALTTLFVLGLRRRMGVVL